MKVFYCGSFVLFVCFTLELTASVDPDVNPKKSVESGVHDSPSGSNVTDQPGDPGGEGVETQTVSRVPSSEGVETHTVSRDPSSEAVETQTVSRDPSSEGVETQTVSINLDDLPKELERRLSALKVNFKQMVGQLEVEWNRDTMLQAVLAADHSLNDLKQLNLPDLPLRIRNKIEKLMQSVENTKTTVYHLIQNKDLEHHNFTGKIGNNSISLDSLREWVISLSSQVIKFEQTLNSSSDILAKASEDVAFELKQLLIFVDRIGWESVPIELQTSSNNLKSNVTAFVNKIATIIEIRNQINNKIRSLRNELDTYEKSGKLENDLGLFRELKVKLTVVMTEVKKPNIPTHLIEDARALENSILLAEKHHISVLLSKLEKILDDIGRKLSFENNRTDLIQEKESLENVLTQSHRVETLEISMEVQIRVFLIERIAMKYKKIVEVKIGYYEHPGSAGIEVSLEEYAQRTFDRTFHLLQQQFDQLKNLYQFKQSHEVLITIKYQIEKIIIHLNYLRKSGITSSQQKLTENFLKDVKYFYLLVLINSNLTQPEIENRHIPHPTPYFAHGPFNNSGQPKEPVNNNDGIIDNLNNRLVVIDVQITFPLNLSRIQEISEALFEIINEVRILEERHLSADQQTETTRIKQRAMDILVRIMLSTQGKTNTTITYVINDNNNGTKHEFDFGSYMKEFIKQFSTLPKNFGIFYYPTIYHNVTNPVGGDEDERPIDISHPGENDQNNTLGCVGRDTYNRDLLLISARVDSLQKYFIQIMDGAGFTTNATRYKEYDIQAEEMLRELKSLLAFGALTRELKLKIEDLEQDLRNLKKHGELMLRVEKGNVSVSEEITLPVHIPKDEDDSNAGLNETMTRILSRLEAIRIQLPQENSLSHVYEMKMEVHHIFVRVKVMSWNVPDSLRDRIQQLEKVITSLDSDIELKIKTIGNPESRVDQILPDPKSEFETTFPAYQSIISHLFYQIENKIQILRRLTLRPEQSFHFGSGFLLKNGQEIHFTRSNQTLTVEDRINHLHQALNYLSRELLRKHVSVTQISEELNHLLIDLKNLKALNLPRRFQYHIDYLTATADNLKIKLDHASAGKVRIEEVYTSRTVHHQHPHHEGYLILGELTTNLKKIQQKYFSDEEHNRLVQILGDIKDILDKLRALKSKYPSSKLSQDDDLQQKIANKFLWTVKQRVWAKIVLPIRSEIENILVRFDSKQTSLSGPRSQTLAVKHEVSTLISDMNAPVVKIEVHDMEERLKAIINRVLEISEKNSPETFRKTRARLTEIIKFYL